MRKTLMPFKFIVMVIASLSLLVLISSCAAPDDSLRTEGEMAKIVLVFENDFSEAEHSLSIFNTTDICGNVNTQIDTIFTYYPANKFDVVVSRAFASTADMLNNSGQHCSGDGVLLAMKGAKPVTELQELPANYSVEAVHQLEVPGLEGQRHLVCLKVTVK